MPATTHPFQKPLHALSFDRNSVVDDSLNVKWRYGFKWILLHLAAPFYYLLGKDPFLHYRIHQVAEAVLRNLEKNRGLIIGNPDLRHEVLLCLSRIQDRCKNEKLSNEINQFLKSSKYFLSNEEYEKWSKWQLPLLNAITKDRDQLEKLARRVIDKTVFGGWSLKANSSLNSLSFESKLPLTDSQPIPHSFRIVPLPSGSEPDLVLFTKAVVGNGAERKVRACYGLLSGRSFIRKKCVSSEEKELYQRVIRDNPEGIATCMAIYNRFRKNGQGVIEVRYSSSLAQLRASLLTQDDKASLISSLIQGINWLHHSYSFHGDINPQNILVDDSRPKRAYLSDFGYSNRIHLIAGQIGFTSPEKLSRLSHTTIYQPIYSSVDHYATDIWSLGVVFAFVLLGSKEHILLNNQLVRNIMLDTGMPAISTPFPIHLNQDPSGKLSQTLLDEYSIQIFLNFMNQLAVDPFSKRVENLVKKMISYHAINRPKATELSRIWNTSPNTPTRLRSR